MNHLPASYFENIYARSADPWGFESRWYEARKYALTVAALPRPRYARCFEVGCSIGVLTRHLAERCNSVLAAELVPAVADAARDRLRHITNVDVQTMAVPETWPGGTFDLVVLSEVLYYFDEAGIREVLDRIDGCLERGGHVVAVHWQGRSDHPLEAKVVHRMLHERMRLSRVADYAEESFLLSVLERA